MRSAGLREMLKEISAPDISLDPLEADEEAAAAAKIRKTADDCAECPRSPCRIRHEVPIDVLQISIGADVQQGSDDGSSLARVEMSMYGWWRQTTVYLIGPTLLFPRRPRNGDGPADDQEVQDR